MTAFWWGVLGLALFVLAGSLTIVIVSRRTQHHDWPIDDADMKPADPEEEP